MVLTLEMNGSIQLEKYPFLGNQYSFWDRLKGVGIGTTKLYYKSGIYEFDQLNKLNVDTAFVNFEPTTYGFILRFNKTNRIRAFGFAKSGIKRLIIEKQILVKSNLFNISSKPKYKGKINLTTSTHHIEIGIPVGKVEQVIYFFENHINNDLLFIS